MEAEQLFDDPMEKNKVKKAMTDIFKVDKEGSSETRNFKTFGMLPR